jgi:predicted outer membrane repeat protein
MKTFRIPSVLRHCAGAVVAAAIVLAGLPASPVSASGVNRYVATTGMNTSNCTSSSAPCKTVTYAINQSGSGDTIFIEIGTFNENIDLSKDLSFVGKGEALTILNGGGSGSVVKVEYGYTASFSSLTITGGNAGTDIGGGIQSYGTLSLDQIQVTNNTAESGGGIYSSGALTMSNSVVSGNNADTDSTGDGGGLFLDSTDPISITNTTVSGNTATSYSGGIHSHVTISGNKALINGAMTNTGNSVTAVVNSTIANNNFSGASGFGGINNYKTISFKNTIIANNASGNCLTGGTGNIWTSLGHNLDSGHSCYFTLAGDLEDKDPKLGALASDSASWIPTLALLAGSPAIDAGTNAGCPATDERGVTRPQGLNCDIGAYELQTYLIYLPLVIR